MMYRLENKCQQQVKKKLSNLILILLITIIILNVAVQLYHSNNHYDRVDIFIIDYFVGEEFNAGEVISHGIIVEDVIKSVDDDLNTNNYDITFRAGDTVEDEEAKYLKGLEEIIAYKRNNPEREVIINVSLVFYEYNQKHEQLIKEAIEEGITIVAAAGNDSLEKELYPAAFSEVIAVANARDSGKEDSSNYGEHIDISAPGNVEKIFSELYQKNFGNYDTNGTSYSAPRVAASLAKLLELEQGLEAEDALEIMFSNSNSISDELYEEKKLGSGLLNLNQAIKEVDIYYYVINKVENLSLFLMITLFFSVVYSLQLKLKT